MRTVAVALPLISHGYKRKADDLDMLNVMMMPTGWNAVWWWRLMEQDRGRVGGTVSHRIRRL